MKNALIVVSSLLSLTIAGGAAANGAMADRLEYDRLSIAGAPELAPETLVLYRSKASAEMTYEILRLASVAGTPVTEKVETGTWEVSRFALDDDDTFVILDPEGEAGTRYALRGGANALQFLER